MSSECSTSFLINGVATSSAGNIEITKLYMSTISRTKPLYLSIVSLISQISSNAMISSTISYTVSIKSNVPISLK